MTTIINLYDTLNLLLLRVHKGPRRAKAVEYKANRPTDEEVQGFIEFAGAFYTRMGELFPALGRYFAAKPEERQTILADMRSPEDGHVLFRPIGIPMFCEVLMTLSSRLTFHEGMDLLAVLPTGMNKRPYIGTVWNPIGKTVDNKKKAVCRDVLLHMLNHRRRSTEELLERYATALGKRPHEVRLPKPLV